jgi:cytochrome c
MRKGLVSFSVVLALLGVALFSIVATNVIMRISRGIPITPEWRVDEADPNMGAALTRKYGCGGCHVIPGVPGANGRVGPSLADLADKAYIVGNLPNTPENLALWIQFPQQIEPGTAMPDMDVTESDARHIAAYLYTLE